ncbi:uncharacterized protein G2W53_032719 [Senna tora]|uniref:Uncharacterized protein n=1 Tax=Senna tora TaxID=362788 RepID=A0A834W7W4_9FABA|nr:uncharacterized protein G2W53_032719 [Senna tora]
MEKEARINVFQGVEALLKA